MLSSLQYTRCRSEFVALALFIRGAILYTGDAQMSGIGGSTAGKTARREAP
jgi:hypothetical protein